MTALERLSSHVNERFLHLREIHEAGAKIIGYIPNGYMPEELVYACRSIPMALSFGGDAAAVAASAGCLNRFLDTFCRAQIGYRILNEEPLYQMLDLLVVPVTDNHTRAIADSWDFYTDTEVFRLGVPHTKSKHGFAYYHQGLVMLKDYLEEFTGNKITKERLIEEIGLLNDIRTLLREISLLRRSNYPPISGKDFVRLNQYSLYADRAEAKTVLESLLTDLKSEPAHGLRRPRILLTGSTLAFQDYKVIDVLEQAGASVVMEEFSEGLRCYWQTVNPEDDVMHALAKSYFTDRVSPACFRGAAEERIEFLLGLSKDSKIDGIIWYSLMYRDSYDVEGYLVHRAAEKIQMPFLKITSDYDNAESGSFQTQIETFVEILKRREEDCIVNS